MIGNVDKLITFYQFFIIIIFIISECVLGENKDNNCAFKCSSNNKCITSDEICDLINNCPDGEDEKQDCGKFMFIFNHRYTHTHTY